MKVGRLFLFLVALSSGGTVCRSQVADNLSGSSDRSYVKKIEAPIPQPLSKFPATHEMVNFNSSLAKRELIKPSAPRKPFLLLSTLVYAAAVYDMRETELEKQRWNRSVASRLPTCPGCLSDGRLVWFRDSDPLARPIVNLPAPAYFATGIAIATGVNWLGWRMARSTRFHKIWFVPQLASIGGNSWGGSTYR